MSDYLISGETMTNLADSVRTLSGETGNMTPDEIINTVNNTKSAIDSLNDHINDKNNPHGVTAESIGARPNTWLPTPEEIGAGRVNPNLLDNWYFGNPVDQRGGYVVTPGSTAVSQIGGSTFFTVDKHYTVTKHNDDWYTFTANGTLWYVYKDNVVRGYTGVGYGIDRWQSTSSTVTILKQDDGIRVLGNGFVLQRLEQDFSGKTLTVSVLLNNGKLCVGTGVMPEEGAPNDDVFSEAGVFTLFLEHISGGVNSLGFAFPENTDLTILAVKLELGTQQTLAHQDENGNWVLNEIPNYNEELLKCIQSTADSSDTYANKVVATTDYAVSKTGDTMTGILCIKDSSQNGGQAVINNWYDVNFGGANAGYGAENNNGDTGKFTVNVNDPYFQRYVASKGIWETYNILHMGNYGSLMAGGTISGNLTVNGTLTGTTVKGAIWNDYAEYREADILEPGRVVCENGDDTLSLSTERLQAGANIISDTFGFSIGETELAKTPIAVSGRVLAYPYEDRDSYNPGDAVCAAPNGTVSKMTREEIREYPERILGTVSSVPQYETWGTGNVPVNGRIWIKVK